MSDIDALRAHHDQITTFAPAPWRWSGYDDRSRPTVYLATEGHGRIIVMGLEKAGFNGAVPVFPVKAEDATWHLLTRADEGLIVREASYRTHIADIDNPVAEYLKQAPTYIATLLAEVDRLNALLANADRPEAGESRG